MDKISFEWDKRKELANFRKHLVHFSEAVTVFYDERAPEFSDPDHSDDEERFLLLGMSRSLRVLIVSYCFRKSENSIRIISSRKAVKKEAEIYFAGEKI